MKALLTLLGINVAVALLGRFFGAGLPVWLLFVGAQVALLALLFAATSGRGW